MHSSKHSTERDPLEFRKIRFLKLWLVLFACVIAFSYVFQTSLARYWQQTWRTAYPLDVLASSPAWRSGALVQAHAEDLHEKIRSVFYLEMMSWNPAWGQAKAVTSTPSSAAPQAVVTQPATAASSTSAATLPMAESASPSTLAPKPLTKVFFVGDSLMQGVAPHVQKKLTEGGGITSINASKQSTGLAYPSFHNWPKIITQTFSENPDIGLMVVFLGANDPWDMPSPKGGPYLRFSSPEWESVYRERIKGILQTAAQHGARVIWLQPPNMEREKLNLGMHYLHTLYQDEVRLAGQIYLPTNAELGMEGQNFAAYAQDAQGQKVRVRTSDGIHFTVHGQTILAHMVLKALKGISPKDASSVGEPAPASTPVPSMAPVASAAALAVSN